jgi:hypothetical protein
MLNDSQLATNCQLFSSSHLGSSCTMNVPFTGHACLKTVRKKTHKKVRSITKWKSHYIGLYIYIVPCNVVLDAPYSSSKMPKCKLLQTTKTRKYRALETIITIGPLRCSMSFFVRKHCFKLKSFLYQLQSVSMTWALVSCNQEISRGCRIFIYKVKHKVFKDNCMDASKWSFENISDYRSVSLDGC